MTTLLWFRSDLRLADNPALAAALEQGGPVVPVFVLDDEDAGQWKAGRASRWWLHHSLQSLARDLEARGSRLVLRRGRAAAEIERLAGELQASSVVWNRCYEPWATARDERLKATLKTKGVSVRSFNAMLLREPWEVMSGKGEPYRVFTPFWKALRAGLQLPAAVAAPAGIPAPAEWPRSDALAEWALLPSRPDWAGGLRAAWTPGEAGALERLDAFAGPLSLQYGEARNLPGREGTSRLSPHLHFGEIGPRQVWRAQTAAALAETGDLMPSGVEVYLSEIAWREFSHHLLFHTPTLPDRPLRPDFADFPWRRDPDGLAAWTRGLTGYPIVDAGMRQLWATGWMHNRVRMIVASFLIKDLLVDWRAGQAWFWDTLVDADLANNAASWQWVAGSGADASPYFRVFNPVTQGEKFDPDGAYVRRWAPELAGLPDKLLHAPWKATPLELADAGVRLGVDYPAPIVDHAVARERALEAYASIRG
ncbi:deoxyribodipyrimidine photolyase [Phenylobacterium sp. Root77]|uniref:cryptochrome/photolyase family protein n=1 Tax=unclassified Phenylobacterium TaxID=2640670 RepID=UPI000701F516|nr:MULTISPECIES: deoxyribodipyrimidine photo-lyase [unclassified Phenylobacterium]KQW66409.1 deoxyribodipyrimidine photolyase [Phenylobacterium sp. Root1277]KQW88915.1 deoxyribodipyrimidine photolyase [Phenylobacterium sp. Root1290]KRC42230.1 deoxyribodipyrimidine photolyase [Phenylobacterium sp. Root77]